MDRPDACWGRGRFVNSVRRMGILNILFIDVGVRWRWRALVGWSIVEWSRCVALASEVPQLLSGTKNKGRVNYLLTTGHDR